VTPSELPIPTSVAMPKIKALVSFNEEFANASVETGVADANAWVMLMTLCLSRNDDNEQGALSDIQLVVNVVTGPNTVLSSWENEILCCLVTVSDGIAECDDEGRPSDVCN